MGQLSHQSTLNGNFDNDDASSRVEPTTDEPTPDASQGDPAFRPFRAWASNYESRESAWTRIRARVRSIFSRSQAPAIARAETASDPGAQAPAVAPPEDFRFPWPGAGEEVSAATSRAQAQESFDSLDDALPATEHDDVARRDGDAAQRSSGFFARLFNRGPAPSAGDDAAIEVHEDRIEAAAEALDQVGQEQFESFEGKSNAGEPFPSVEEALPTLGDLTQSEPRVDANSTTAEGPLVFIPVLDAIETPPPRPFRPASSAPPTPSAPTVPTEPAPEEADATFDGGSTQDVEVKTDEFEIAALEGPTDAMDLKKRSWTSTFFARLFRRGDTKLETIGADAEEAARVSSGFLLAKFRAFYNEIIRLQHQKSEFTAGFATAILADMATDATPDAAAEALSKRLSELLELQAAEAKWMGGEAGMRYPDAQYAMAALADEIITHSDWEGKAAWPRFSLERKLHRSHDSEVEVFRRIDRLLKEQTDSVVARDLARVYLLVLAAGFKGKWRPFGLTRPLAEYRRRLYEYIYGADPLMLYADDRRVCPDAASRTLEGHAVSRFTALQRWVAIVVFLVVSYTVIAHIAWSRASADLKDVTARIQSTGGGAAAGEVSQQ